jgi:hypothetical protein
MKKGILLAVIIICCNCANAQTGVFKTYDDYLNGTMEKMEDDVKVTGTSFGLSYHFTTTDGNAVKYKPKHFWGFIFKGTLFRSDGHFTAMLQDTGKVWYYLNGEAGVAIIRNGTSSGVTIIGPYCYLSADGVNEPLYAMPNNGMENGKYKKFKTNYPQFELLYDCVGKYSNYQNLHTCVKSFNAGSKK